MEANEKLFGFPSTAISFGNFSDLNFTLRGPDPSSFASASVPVMIYKIQGIRETMHF